MVFKPDDEDMNDETSTDDDYVENVPSEDPDAENP